MFIEAEKEEKELKTYKKNLESGMDYCFEIAQRTPYKDENLSSIPPVVTKQRQRLNRLFNSLKETVNQ